MTPMTPDAIYEEYMKLSIAHSIALELLHSCGNEDSEPHWEIVRGVRNGIHELRILADLPKMRVYVDGQIYDKPILRLSEYRVFAWVGINLWPLKFRDSKTWQIDYDYED